MSKQQVLDLLSKRTSLSTISYDQNYRPKHKKQTNQLSNKQNKSVSTYQSSQSKTKMRKVMVDKYGRIVKSLSISSNPYEVGDLKNTNVNMKKNYQNINSSSNQQPPQTLTISQTDRPYQVKDQSLPKLITSTSTTSTTKEQIFEFFPVDDPIWEELIPQEIIQDKNFDLKKIISDNYEYFINLLGLVYHEREQKYFPKTNVALPTKKLSTYHNEFTSPARKDSQINQLKCM